MKKRRIFILIIWIVVIVLGIIVIAINESERSQTRTDEPTPVPTAETIEIISLNTEMPVETICEASADTCGHLRTLVDTEAPTEEPTETPTEAPTREPDSPTKLTFLATAYSSDDLENGGWGPVDCLYGKPLPENAIAANLSQLPYGTRVYIDGIGERIVVDTASEQTLENMKRWADAKNADGWIDIYCNGDKEWMDWWGVRLVTLTILEWGDGK